MSHQCFFSQCYITMIGFLVFFYTLFCPRFFSYYCLCQALMYLLFFFIYAQALTWRYYSSAFSTYLSRVSSLLQGYQVLLLQGALGSLYSLFRRNLIYFITLELYSFYALYITIALIYSYRGGMLAFFLSSTMAVYLYPPIMFQT